MTDQARRVLEALIKKLRETGDVSGRWAIDWRSLASFLRMPPARVLRAVQEMRHRINPTGDPGDFSQDHPEQLIEVLEDLWGDDSEIEKAFQEADLFLNYRDQVAIQQEIFDRIDQMVRRADLGEDRMNHLFRRFNGRWENVFEHLREWLKADRWLDTIVDEFLREGRDTPTPAFAYQLHRYVDHMRQRNVFSMTELLSALRQRCQAWGRRWHGKDEPETSGEQISVETTQALREMEFDQPPTREALKKRYRKLMLKHHPDVNPQGQERSVRINRAYSLLVNQLSDA